MSIPYFDFTKAELPEAPDYFSTALEGFQKGQDRALTRERDIFKNKLLKEYGEERERVEIDKLKAEGSKELLAARIASQKADANYKNSAMKSGDLEKSRYNRMLWSSIPPDVRNDAIASVVGGTRKTKHPVSAHAAAMRLANGELSDDIILASGGDLANSDKIFSPTTAVRTDLTKTEGRMAEVDELERFTTSALQGYGGRNILGYSVPQVLDAITNNDPEKQGRFLAARAIQSGLSGARVAIESGSNAQVALQDMRKKALTEISIFKPFVSNEAWNHMQHILNDELRNALKKRRDVVTAKTSPDQLYNKSSYDDAEDIPESYELPNAESKGYTQAGLESTAKKRNMTVQQVKQKLGVR